MMLQLMDKDALVRDGAGYAQYIYILYIYIYYIYTIYIYSRIQRVKEAVLVLKPHLHLLPQTPLTREASFSFHSKEYDLKWNQQESNGLTSHQLKPMRPNLSQRAHFDKSQIGRSPWILGIWKEDLVITGTRKRKWNLRRKTGGTQGSLHKYGRFFYRKAWLFKASTL